MEVRIVGIPWYDADDFDELRKLFDDRDVLHGTHREWLAAATGLERQLMAQGYRVVRGKIKPKEFDEWCAAKGLKRDAEARNEFASLIAAKVHLGSSEH
jgi:hypothetical protein